MDNYAEAVEFVRGRFAEHLQEPVAKSEAARVVDAILSKNPRVKNAKAYVTRSITRDPSEWITYMLNARGGATS